jgi:hypothetical protein
MRFIDSVDDGMISECGAVGRETEYSEKVCPSATLYTTNLTWPDLELIPGRRGGEKWRVNQ